MRRHSGRRGADSLKWPLIVVSFGIGLLLSLYGAYSWRASEITGLQLGAVGVAAQHAHAILPNIRKSAVDTMSLATVLEAAGDDIDRDGFLHFAQGTVRGNPVIDRVIWLGRVDSKNRGAFEADLSRRHPASFQITEQDWSGHIAPASARSLYYPILEIFPRSGNEDLIGFDFGSNREMQNAASNAIRTNSFDTFRNPVGFLRRDPGDLSYFVIAPVYNRKSQAANRGVRGFVVSEINLGRVLTDGAPPPGRFTPVVAIYDLDERTSEQLVYPARFDIPSDQVTDAGGSYTDFDMGVAQWRVATFPRFGTIPWITWQSTLVLLAGLVFTVNFTAYLATVTRRRQQVENMVRIRTKELGTALSQLQSTDQKLRDYVDTASDWYWETGPDYRFTSISGRAREIGIDPAKLIGIDQLTDGAAQTEIDKRLAVLDRREPFKEFRYDYPLPDGLMVLSLTGKPVFGRDRAFLGYRGSARDITRSLRIEAEQRMARWNAEQASRAKSAFLANMSHEIRTPMNGVLGMVQILRRSGLNDEQLRMCEIISRSGSTLLQILNDILDFSKLEAGKIELEAVDCQLSELVGDVVSLMRHTADAKGISIVFEDHAAAQYRIVADPTRLRQILLNLVSNAIKFSSQGCILVRLDTAVLESGQLHICLAITDQGIGMSPEVQRRLFQRFTQADVSLTRRFGGTGLGLAITRELVALMQGTIAVESQLGRGSTFTVGLDLPLASHETTDAQIAGDGVPEGPRVQLNVLIAEDDEVNRIVIGGLLKEQGHKIAVVENGRKAVAAVAANAEIFDLVLMDIMMPELDGVAATLQIRQLPGPAATIPIIALTANAMSGDRDTYLAAGMNAYVSKPIEQRQFFSTIEQVLNKRVWTPEISREAARPGVISTPHPEALGQLEDFISSL